MQSPRAHIDDRCPCCGKAMQLIRVHGHDQCAHCGANLQPCCQPQEPLDRESPSDPPVRTKYEQG